MLSILHGDGDLNLGLHACAANTLLTEPSCQLGVLLALHSDQQSTMTLLLASIELVPVNDLPPMTAYSLLQIRISLEKYSKTWASFICNS